MRSVLISTMCLCLALAGCSKGGTYKVAEKLNLDSISGDPVAPPTAPGEAGGVNKGDPAAAPIAVSLPQIAYDYTYGFRLPADAVAGAQQAHIAACDRLGPAKCQLVSSQSSSSGSSETTLKLRVASAIARAFGAQLVATIARAGGRAVDQSIVAEDVSKDMSDTVARIHQRELLVARLTRILETRTGKVADLVEAERSIADAQEELDKAKAWLTELQGRVAMSNVAISYNAVVAPVPAQGTIGETVGQSWGLFAGGLGAFLRGIIFLLPWALLIAAIGFGIRAVVQRRLRRAEVAAADEPLPDA